VVEAVTVLDKDGKPMEGLTPQDFTVTENGTAQQIKLFEFQKLDLTPLAPLAADTPAVQPSTMSSQIAVRQPGTIQYRDRRLLALYFDLGNMGQAEQMRSLQSANDFIDKNITAADLVAVLEFSNGSVNVRQDFTDSRPLLKAALEKIVAEALNLEDPDFNLSAAFGQDAGEFNLFSTDRQLAALQTAIQMLGRLSEKKALIYFAGGIRMGGIDNLAQMRATVNASNRANVSIFPVDARGLVAFTPMGDASQRGPGGASAYTGAAMASMATSLQRSQDTLYALSADTGGKALLDNNNLGRGITDAQKALSSYYLIGYYTTNNEKDGKFRKIQITVCGFSRGCRT
jgi:VWFA-related protein